jgi:HK97 family phage portal protein
MNIIETFQRWLRPVGKYDAAVYTDAPSFSGVSVGEQSALSSSAVWACVNLIAQTVATLPFRIYRKGQNNNRQQLENNLDYLLNYEPSPDYHAFTFKELMTASATLHGNAYAEIVRDASGAATSLYYIPATQVQPYWDTVTESVWYAIYQGDYRHSEPYMGLPAARMLHLLGLGWDGLVGYSPIHLQRESIGLHLAGQRYGASFFKNGGRPAGILKFPNKLSPEAKDNLRRTWEGFHAGTSNTGRVAILEGGLEYSQLQINPDEAQFIETQKYSREEIASIFRVPASMIGAADPSDNVEAVSLEFLRSIQPWLVRWEMEINRKLIQRMDEYCEADTRTVLRTDLKTRYESYALGRQWGFLSVKDIREAENMPSDIPGMEEYLKPMNMEPLDAMPVEQPAQEIPSAPSITAPAVSQPDTTLPADRSAERNLYLGKVLAIKMRELRKVETNDLRRATDNPKHFLQKLDEIRKDTERRHAEAFEPILRAFDLDEAGRISKELAKDLADQFHSKFLDLSGNCTASELAQTIDLAASAWVNKNALLDFPKGETSHG